MSNDIERKAFERKFPVPGGIFWNEISEQYDAAPGAGRDELVEIYHGQWIAWQAASAHDNCCSECGPVDGGTALYCVKCWESAQGRDVEPYAVITDGDRFRREGVGAAYKASMVSRRHGDLALHLHPAPTGGTVPDKITPDSSDGPRTGAYVNGWNDAVDAMLAAAPTIPPGADWVRCEDDKLHWYALSYRGKDLEGGRDADAVTYTGFPENRLTKQDIQDGKANAGVYDKAVLVCATYLGHMTRQEFLSQPPIEQEDPAHE